MAKNLEQFNFTNDAYLILAEHSHYTRTATGKSWKAHPDEIEHVILTPTQYTNFITAAPWFNRFFRYDFNGRRTSARCTVSYGYTVAGYLPTHSTNVNPDGTKKTVTRISFLYKPDLEKAAGYRERDRMARAVTWEYDYENGYSVYTFTTGDGESAAYSEKRRAWVN